MLKAIEHTPGLIKSQRPLILNYTNTVTTDFVANALLAIGAAPVMSLCEAEALDLIKISAAVYINLGTLSPEFIHLVDKAIMLASLHKKPIILDPVGAGASKIRTQTATRMALKANIIKGNASEILALAGLAYETKGVDAADTHLDVTEAAKELAQATNAVVAVSGATDIITDGNEVIKLRYGSALMSCVTGMGCSLGAVMAAFKAVVKDPLKSTSLAMAFFALTGELTGQKFNKPGGFKHHFIDALYAPDFSDMTTRIKPNAYFSINQ